MCNYIFCILGFKDINILGVEGNGLSRLMCNENSHWDGKDTDYENHNSLLYANDMISSQKELNNGTQSQKIKQTKH